MRIVDLSHALSPDMPVYPGTEPPLFTPACRIEDVGFRELKITLFSHTGTHIDAPAHIIADAKPLDQLPFDRFYGNATLLKPPSPPHQRIDIGDLTPFQPAIERSDFVLFHTGWNRFWGTRDYFSGYPVLSEDAASWLCGFGLKGVGMDTISADPAESHDLPIHNILLKHEMIIIENLTHLDRLPASGFTFSCFPLKIENADGSPVRAVAFLPESVENYCPTR